GRGGGGHRRTEIAEAGRRDYPPAGGGKPPAEEKPLVESSARAVQHQDRRPVTGLGPLDGTEAGRRQRRRGRDPCPCLGQRCVERSSHRRGRHRRSGGCQSQADDAAPFHSALSSPAPCPTCPRRAMIGIKRPPIAPARPWGYP